MLRFDKHAVVAADNLGGAIARRLQEILIGLKYHAIKVETDHGLGAVNGGDLSTVICRLRHRFCDVGRVFYDSFRTTNLVQYGIIRGFDPNLPATLTEAQKLRRNILTCSKSAPK